MATVTEKPASPPGPGDLEALIAEARARKRRRQRRKAAALAAAAAGAAAVAYAVAATIGGSSGGDGKAPTAALGPGGAKPEIVFAATRSAVLYGEIFRVDSDGRIVDLSRSPALDMVPAVSPDGKRVAFLSERGGAMALYAVHISGGSLRRLSAWLPRVDTAGLSAPVFPARVVWSPNGKQLLVTDLERSSSYLVSAFGRPNARRVVARSVPWYGASRESQQPVISADGSRAASVRPVGGLATASRWVLTVSRRDESRRRVLVGASCAPLGLPSPAFVSVQFTPTGRSLVYQSNCLEPAGGLYVIRPDGSQLRRLTRTSADLGYPASSPSGRSIAFTRQDCAGCSFGGIWLMDADGRKARPLTFPGPDETDVSPSWSPDGKSLAFMRIGASGGGLYVVPVGHGHARLVHAFRVSSWGAVAWGPRRIAYAGADGTIRTIDPDGGHPRTVAAGGWAGRGPFAWSRDGRLAYLEGGRTVDVAGTRASITLPDALKACRLAARGCYNELAWSPDGGRLVVSAEKGSNPSELYVIDLASHRVRPLTKGMGAVFGVSWR
jgi:Tol biopolymer transport system component